MGETVHKSYGGLLARIALWSLVSLPCFWVPLFADYWYAVDDSRLGIGVCFGIPFLCLAASMVILALGGMDEALESCSKGRRRALSLVALATSAPVLVPIAVIGTIFMVTLVYDVYTALRGGAIR
jgi:hypothetical protein